jgi:neutral ceramidase
LFAGTLGDRFSIQHDTDYWASVADKLIGGINQAHSQLEPARLGIAASTAAANVNRRQRNADGRTVLGVNPEGPADRQLGVFRLERPDGSLIGLIANYTIHGTALGGGNTQITGDAPGFAAQYVERSTGVPLLFINGALGNVAPVHSVGSNIEDPRLKEYDRLLGEPILAAQAAISNATADVTLRLGKTVVETPRKTAWAGPTRWRTIPPRPPTGRRWYACRSTA